MLAQVDSQPAYAISAHDSAGRGSPGAGALRRAIEEEGRCPLGPRRPCRTLRDRIEEFKAVLMSNDRVFKAIAKHCGVTLA